VRELACQFGEEGRLHGVVTVPSSPAPPRPALVLVSAGLTAKPGPYRLYTQIARTLAEQGCTTLRFDLGGIGNSQIASPDEPLSVRTGNDIGDALAYLEANHGVREFVIGGLCSGAEDAFRYAEHDERTKGVILIDPHVYQNTYWRFRGYLTRYTLNRVVFKFLRLARLVNVVEDRGSRSNIEGLEGSLIDYQYMEKGEATRILSALLARDAGIHYIYTGGSIDLFHHPNQFRSMFPGLKVGGRLAVDFLPFIEHIQIFDEDRDVLVDTITRWFAEIY
jgi:pimeloyl-ACP methyl ester carboxylesterase